jgi:pimeloyl-ACP methyl ester carboxylesterase
MSTLLNYFEHYQFDVNGISTHIAETGDKNNQTVLFLHGYPESWMAFSNVMTLMEKEYHLISIDMPGIGKSGPIASCDKLAIAHFINDLIKCLNLRNVVLAGHDLGGMVTYSVIRNFPENISKAVIMNTAIPGVEPWEEVKRNPYIWHFAFFAIPELPEIVFSGKQRLLFDYFFNIIAANPEALDDSRRNIYASAYDSPSSLKTGFDWYRAFPEDEKENSRHVPVNIPVLYLRGEKEYGNIDQYLAGFKKSGFENIAGEFIPNSGHFAAEEAPEAVAKAIDNFIKKNS